MPENEKVKDQLARFELVDWHYDGVGGKVIAWTKEHGGHSDDPAAQAFVLTHEGKVVARAEDDGVGLWIRDSDSLWGIVLFVIGLANLGACRRRTPRTFKCPALPRRDLWRGTRRAAGCADHRTTDCR